MPPKRKAKLAAPTGDAPVDAPVNVLLARCSRGALEALLAEAVTSGQPVTYDHIKQQLPEAKHSTRIARPKVNDGVAREGTGWFDDLDDELLIEVLSHVQSTETRLNCAIEVCKSWRSALKQMSLFTRISLRAGSYSRYPGSVRATSANVERLVGWLPDAAAVQSLELDVGDKHTSLAPDVTKRILPRFRGLTSLSLRGKKISAALLAGLAKQPFAVNLQSFELGDCQAKAPDAIPLLRYVTAHRSGCRC